MYFNTKRILIMTIIVMSVLALLTVAIWAFVNNNADEEVDISPTKIELLPTTTIAPTPTTVIPTEAPIVTPTVKPEPTATLEPTMVPTEKPTATPTEELKPTATPEPTTTVTPTATPKPTKEPKPTVTPEPTKEPTVTPTVKPEPTATHEPTEVPTEKPTATPTEELKPTATPEPTTTVTPTATPKPTKAPAKEEYEVPVDRKLKESLHVSPEYYSRENLPMNFETEEQLTDWLVDRQYGLDIEPVLISHGFELIRDKECIKVIEYDEWNSYWYEYIFQNGDVKVKIVTCIMGSMYVRALNARELMVIKSIIFEKDDEVFYEFDYSKYAWPDEGLEFFFKKFK